jgi:hypothetical protein
MKEIKLNKAEFLALNPCEGGRRYVERFHYDMRKAWKKCLNGCYMIWLLESLANSDNLDYDESNRLHKQVKNLVYVYCSIRAELPNFIDHRRCRAIYAKEIRRCIPNPFQPKH